MILLVVSIGFCAPLTGDDYKNINKQKRTETLIYETCKPLSSTGFSMIGVQFDRYLSEAVYVGGTAYGAVSGGRGGYALGSINLGYTAGSPLFVDLKVMVGGSGGGGVGVKGGLLIQLMVTIGYRLTPDLECRFGFGKYFSLDNNFEADILNIGISFSTQHLFLPLY